MNGERLRQARELCGFRQQELAELAGIAQSAIAQMEAGMFQPSEELALSLARHTGFDLAFLNKPESPGEFPVGSLLYRSKSRVSPRDKTKAHRMAQMVFEMAVSLRAKFRPIPVTLPRLNNEMPIEAARIARSQLALSPDTPIQNLTAVLERAGVLIFRIPLNVDGLDGFSAWVGKDRDIPIICLVGSSVGYRSRYTIAEETGHLLMHSPLRVTVEQAEKEVKPFVGEFLLPEEAMRRELCPPVTLGSLAQLKPRWGASIQFLAARSSELGLTTANQYKYLMQQVSSRGWRTAKSEPGDAAIPQETPQLLLRVIQATYGDPVDLKRARRELGLPMWLVREIALAHGVSEMVQSTLLEMPSRRF
jgi:Zn-dependent peptidase ImmA (M78 family)/transcriptional regulator with XRE-family HTH domain